MTPPALLADKNERSLVPLCLTVFIDMLGLGLSIPVLAVILFDGSINLLPSDTPHQLRTIIYGFLIASYPLAQFFGAPILGALSDRFGRKPPLIFSLIGTMIGYILFGLGILWGDLPLLFASRAFDGFTGGNLSIAVAAIADISQGNQKSHNFGLAGMAFGLGLIVGPYVGGKLADPTLVPWFNAATPFFFAAGLTAINVLLFLLLFGETIRARKATPVSILMGFRNLKRAMMLGRLRTMLLVVFLLTLGFNFFTQFFNVFLVEKFAYNESQIGDLFGYTGIWLAVTQGMILKPVTRRVSLPRTLSASCLLLAISIPLLLIPDSPLFLFFILPFVAIFEGLVDPIATTMVSDLSAQEEQGEILGIKQSLQSLAAAAPPIIAGFVATVHVSLPIWVASGCTIAAWALFRVGFHHGDIPKGVGKGLDVQSRDIV